MNQRPRRWNERDGIRFGASYPPPELDWDLLAAGPTSALDHGVVSCLCVTRGRLEQLQRAVRCYQAQTYRHRELVVVYERLEDGARQLLESLGAAVSCVPVPPQPKQPLGALRNAAIAASRGDYLCCWDDDDWYSPRRLELQLGPLASSGADASLLTRWLVLDEQTGRACVSAQRLWEGSLLCRRSLPIVRAGYAPLSRDEDRLLVQQLCARHCVFLLERPELYVYRFHGGNTWGADHFQAIFSRGVALSDDDAERLRRAIGAESSRSIGS